MAEEWKRGWGERERENEGEREERKETVKEGKRVGGKTKKRVLLKSSRFMHSQFLHEEDIKQKRKAQSIFRVTK